MPSPTSPEYKAEVLLLRHLTEEQKRELREHHYFTVHSPVGNRYKIWYTRSGSSINLVGTTAREQVGFCVHPFIDIPSADRALSLKLMVEGAEADFFKVANPIVHGKSGGELLRIAKLIQKLISKPIGPAVRTEKYRSRWLNR